MNSGPSGAASRVCAFACCSRASAARTEREDAGAVGDEAEGETWVSLHLAGSWARRPGGTRFLLTGAAALGPE
jgi:hypothetical protein